MEREIRALAPAKINLHLRVYGRRADGFHGLRSVFQAISLADEMIVRSLKQPERIEIDGAFDCPPEKTTFHRAIVAFREATGIRDGISVSVKKAIPAGGGLGGGSSDAASTLLALDRLFDAGLGTCELSRLGSSIGSDVPFFIHGGAALVSGRGEHIEPIPSREDFLVLLVFPGFPVSTPEAYRLLDEERPDDSLEEDPDEEKLRSMYRRPPRTWTFSNSFEKPIGHRWPAIPDLLLRLRSSGAGFSCMSGSGSTLFGIFETEEKAMFAARAIEERRIPGLGTLLARPLACTSCLL